MPRRKSPDRLELDGREYLVTEIAAPKLGISVGRLRELARGYGGRDGKRANSVPCQIENRSYYFNIDDVRNTLNDIRHNHRYLRGL